MTLEEYKQARRLVRNTMLQNLNKIGDVAADEPSRVESVLKEFYDELKELDYKYNVQGTPK